jgi:hypothetical protein
MNDPKTVTSAPVETAAEPAAPVEATADDFLGLDEVGDMPF